VLIVKIAMFFWCQVSGFRCQEACSPEGTIHHLRHTLRFPLNPDT